VRLLSKTVQNVGDCNLDVNSDGSGIGRGEEIDKDVEQVKGMMFRKALRWLMLPG
jgi:hypothetical protein